MRIKKKNGQREKMLKNKRLCIVCQKIKNKMTMFTSVFNKINGFRWIVRGNIWGKVIRKLKK